MHHFLRELEGERNPFEEMNRVWKDFIWRRKIILTSCHKKYLIIACRATFKKGSPLDVWGIMSWECAELGSRNFAINDCTWNNCVFSQGAVLNSFLELVDQNVQRCFSFRGNKSTLNILVCNICMQASARTPNSLNICPGDSHIYHKPSHWITWSWPGSNHKYFRREMFETSDKADTEL